MAPDEVRRRLTLTVNDVLKRSRSRLTPGSVVRVDSVVGRLSTLVRSKRLSEDSADEALRKLLKRLRAKPSVFPTLTIRLDQPARKVLTIGAPRRTMRIRTKAMKRQVKSARPVAHRPPPGASGAAAAPPTASPGVAKAEAAAASGPGTRSAFPLLHCDGVVVAQREFPVTFGLAEVQDAGVVGDPLDVPLSGRVTIQIVATGFSARPDESLRQVVTVSQEHPYPAVTIHLTPDAQRPRVVTRALQAIYSVDARTIGMAVRAVSVVKDASLVDATPAPAQGQNQDVRLPAGATAADVTIRLILDRAQAGKLTWAFETRFADVAVPDEPPTSTIGTDPQAFARKLMLGINVREGTPRLEGYLRGAAKRIASKMPDDFWRIFRQAAQRAGGPPAVLILSEEPYVPWELAFVDDPLVDPAAPPFLGAQCNIGRWPLRTAKLPPPQAVDVSAVAVVTGVYDRPGWKRLEAAEDEADKLVRERFKGMASSVKAIPLEVMNCLQGTPPADLLHFAIHGAFDPNGLADGLVMLDGSFLDPLEVAGSMLARRPFVFLNACQVGQGNTILGDYAGMAESFVSAGASAVIAPLWSVKDSVARDFALRFYEPGETLPAGALRAGRVSAASTGLISGTVLAYQFFGHPALKLRLPMEDRP